MICEGCGNEEDAKFLAHQVQGVYDGVLVWQCLACGHAWPRVFDIPARDAEARRYADNLIEQADQRLP